MKHVLILGGTTEARLLAERLAGRADLDVTLSLAGRTVAPARQAVPVRSGGFGGAAGLADYLVRKHIDVLIDATHPFASTISANACAAAQTSGVRFVAVRRPPWIAIAGDCWTEVENVRDAVRAQRTGATAASAAAFLFDPQRRSGRSAFAASARGLCRGPRPVCRSG
jgi:precorrin-6A/cobalt-precorrin-6A reductase